MRIEPRITLAYETGKKIVECIIETI